VKLFEAGISSQKNLADYFRDVLFLSSEEKKANKIDFYGSKD